jgi:hypothetical protein
VFFLTEFKVLRLQETWDDPGVFVFEDVMEEVFSLLQSKAPPEFHRETNIILFLPDSVVEIKMPRCALLYYPKFLQLCQKSVPGYGMEVQQAWLCWHEVRKPFMDEHLHSLGIERCAAIEEADGVALHLELRGDNGKKLKEILNGNNDI